MIIISSFRPNATGEYSQNQHRARSTWLNAFDGIIYFNTAQADMAAPRISFRESPNPPTIKRLMECASRSPDWCAIANADIVVNRKFRLVEAKLRELGAKCAVSRRFTFDPARMSEPAKADDLGLDIFCAVPEVWKRAAEFIPEQYVIGKQRWDCWTLAFFMVNWPDHCWEFSRAATIFHPIHGGRGDQSMEAYGAVVESSLTWPTKQIEL